MHLLKNIRTTGPLTLQAEQLVLVIILPLQAFHLNKYIFNASNQFNWNISIVINHDDDDESNTDDDDDDGHLITV